MEMEAPSDGLLFIFHFSRLTDAIEGKHYPVSSPFSYAVALLMQGKVRASQGLIGLLKEPLSICQSG